MSPNDTFRYDLASLRLERLDLSGGVVETLDFDDSESSLYGHWQLLPVGQAAGSGAAPADSSRAPGGTLLLLARTPFEYLQSVWQPSDGTDAPADIPTYRPVPHEPPASSTINLCDEIGVSSDPGSDWLPGDGETADGIPDPAAPTETAAANGVVIVVHGFPESSGSNGRLSDPTGESFQVDLEFPGPVVITVVTVRPCQGFVGTTTVHAGRPTGPNVIDGFAPRSGGLRDLHGKLHELRPRELCGCRRLAGTHTGSGRECHASGRPAGLRDDGPGGTHGRRLHPAAGQPVPSQALDHEVRRCQREHRGARHGDDGSRVPHAGNTAHGFAAVRLRGRSDRRRGAAVPR